MGLPIIGTILGAIAKPLTTIIDGWQKRKTAKTESEIAINAAVTDAKIKHLENKQQADIAWENTALANAGIKDEIMMAVILTPMVMCFIPGGAEIVREGFAAMDESLPSYWEKAFLATVGVSYGLRKFTDFMSIKKG